MFSKSAIAARRARVEANLGLGDHVLVVDAGNPIGIPGNMDQEYAFTPHPDYFWLTGSRRPGGAVAYIPGEGWREFIEPVSEAERVWSGVTEEPAGEPIAHLASILATIDKPVVRLGGQERTPNRPFEAELWHLRRPKDAEELTLLRVAAEATRAGHAVIEKFAHAGITERELAIEMEAEFLRFGASGTGYNSIVGFADHAAVLHFSPTSRKLQETDLVLVDAGAQVNGYVIDVTRTYRAKSGVAQELYQIVLAALRQSSALLVAGTEWLDVHYRACYVIADGLRQLGVLNCEPELACESGAIATFMPHGIGHAVGLGVRDCSGPYPGREPGHSCGSAVRCNFPLAPGYLMTVEPGCYFIEPLLNNRERREKFKNEINWEKASALIPLGGVRLEDNLLVTEGEPQNLTISIPL